jgi:hypothetical protein
MYSARETHRTTIRAGECPFAGAKRERKRGRSRGERNLQRLVLTLAELTAADYLTWMRDPEPRALGGELRCITVRADPLGARIDLELRWSGHPPAPVVAAEAAGFPATPGTAEVRSEG